MARKPSGLRLRKPATKPGRRLGDAQPQERLGHLVGPTFFDVLRREPHIVDGGRDAEHSGKLRGATTAIGSPPEDRVGKTFRDGRDPLVPVDDRDGPHSNARGDPLPLGACSRRRAPRAEILPAGRGVPSPSSTAAARGERIQRLEVALRLPAPVSIIPSGLRTRTSTGRQLHAAMATMSSAGTSRLDSRSPSLARIAHHDPPRCSGPSVPGPRSAACPARASSETAHMARVRSS